MIKRGRPANLQAAARRKHEAAVERAEQALRALIRTGEPITFRAVARLADCSPDFLYRTPALRTRIEQLRAQPRRAPTSKPAAGDASSNVVRDSPPSSRMRSATAARRWPGSKRRSPPRTASYSNYAADWWRQVRAVAPNPNAVPEAAASSLPSRRLLLPQQVGFRIRTPPRQ